MTFGTKLRRRVLPFLTLFALSTLANATPPGLQAAFPFPAPLTVNSGAQTASVPIVFQTGGTVAGVQVVTQGKSGADYTPAPGGTCSVGQTYAAGQSCVQTVQFAPKSPGPRRGAILLLDSNGILLATQPLYGTGTGGAGVLLPGTMRTVAGNGTWVYRQDGVPATAASIFLPGGVAIDGAGNLFLSDTSNNRIRRVDAASGFISTVAGTGTPSAAGDAGPGVNAGVNLPSGMVIDGAGDILFADSGNNAVRRLSLATGLLTTIAGQLGAPGNAGDGGPATAALLNTPEGVALDAAGNLYIADTSNHEIRRVDALTGIITRVVGSGSMGATGDGGPGAAGSLNSPWSIALDVSGNLYIADLGNNKIRKLSAGGMLSTFAGTGVSTYNGDNQAATSANLKGPAAVLADVAGNVYIADSGNNLIRKVLATTGLLVNVAGTGNSVFDGDGGKATEASMYGPYALALDDLGNVFFSDIFHHRIREIQNSLSKLKFLPIQVGRTSVASPVQIENDGNAPMNFSSLAPDRNSAIDPGTTTCDTNTPLSVVAMCTIGAQFSPQVTGADVTAEIDLNSDASNTPAVLLLDGEVDALDPTTTTLTSSANPAALDASVSLTAVVAGGSSPTGSVRFYDGNTLLATVPMQGLTATLSTSALAIGTHPITANYTGDAANAPSTSAVLNEIVKQTPAIVLTSSANPSQVGVAVTFSATVTGSNVAPAGSVVFSDGGSAIGNGAINGSGVAVFSTSSLPAGTHTITASFAGDANTLPGASAPLTQMVNRWLTTTTLSTGNPSPAIGDSIVLSVHVTRTSSVPATGAVQLNDGAVLLTTLTLDAQGNAGFTTTSLAVGSHTLVASLQSDATNDASTSAPLLETVTTIATSTALSSSANPVNAGATLHLTAQVTPASTNNTAGTLGGTVTFTEGGVTLGIANVAGSGLATLDLNTLAVGTHPIVASYSGDTDRASSASAPLAQAVVNAATTVQLVSSGNPSIAGRGITFTAVVSGNGGVPTGVVTFLDGGTSLGTGTVNGSGQANLTTSALTAGTHSVTAAYAGDARDAASTSSVLSQVVQQTTTALTLTSSVNPSFAGATVTFTASLTSNGSVPSGPVVLTDGGNVMATGALSVTGGASFPVANLTAGTHSLVVSFAGDPDHAASNSAPLAQLVQMGTSAVSLTASGNPSLVGTQMAFSVAVTGTANRPTGTVALMDGASTLTTLTLNASGGATFSTSALPIGDHPITAVYAGDSTHAGSSAALLTVRVQQATTVTLLSSRNPSVVGDTVVFTATVNGANAIVPTGTVSFSDGGTIIGTAPVANGVATLSTASLPAGTHLIAASYAGDAASQTSVSAVLSQAVNTAGTTVTLASSANPSVTGSPVTFSATVVSAGKVPTGAVSFLEGASVLGTGTVTNGVAGFTTSALVAGQHAIVARYGGDAGTQTSTSAALVQVTQQRTTLSLTSSVNPAQTVQGIVLTAAVGNGAHASGVVTFSDNGAILSSVALDASATATLTVPSLSAGSHALTASYGGDSQNLPSTAPGLGQTVQLRPTTTSMTSSSDTYLSGQQITLVAVVDANGPVAPTGSVTFTSGGASLGTAPVSPSGAATLTLYPLANTYTVIANYAGDAVYSTSASAGYTINAGPVTTFSMTPSWTKGTLSSGAHTAVDLTFTSVKGFNDVLALGCLELPTDATCTFSADKMALKANGTEVVHLTIDTGNPLGAGSLVSLNRPAAWPGVAAAGLLSLLFLGRRRRGMPWLLAATGLAVLSGGLSGCANQLVQAKTPPGTYTVRILASGTQSGASQVADLTVTVTP